MDYIYVFSTLATGLILGSFMSVLVFRLDVRSGIISGRSECPRCLTRLKWYDLVPLLSFIYLGAKCRYCKNKISAVYPAMELATAGVFVTYSFLNGYSSLNSFYELAIIFILLALLFSDYIFYILPDKLIIAGFLISLAYFLLFKFEIVGSSLITGLVLSATFAILNIVSGGRWMGLGDAKLAFFIGFVLSYPSGVWAILISIWIGAIWGIVLVLLKRANLKTHLPFGSFMAAVAVLLIIFQKHEIWIPLIPRL
ncbi:MAG: hypothetical protein A3B91_03590 [Candidatus Yanofskybacteria bacterium RIFCSPHIGHO2_02_FULL_41_29]|uniref:Prepilin peptidase n=1 Tax=Candidatus Yanofskybacteria bacterium RIFCSPHIGHO2_01_FULL_41_53 TaxID=1802663 RepID=A0A1F8ELB9_9BACT|nr:MAG: hypothetical protein A2650_00755 [Candidatus Yanofskybacteria bacterium RIFCSPHIGHO2_01_FULL_41_53]OGN10841.1 MAG: hypothetical protein A3B91_03590 [Candidatus Yanofskybacteria bacterium RIFCSPHIGHO2_02_FULL_41_29]OGN18547.1 MAG: hypothetical protein A3F48_01225 [Candidatus Yanofskybacteria bacterium RIFCSPHIGHO2_12_FULL_41_9]OGN24495.1 MAG: hypothetical protein A2916_02590 [Candidatus Yanofskybacteria bacterium RIFCSPLOWO2_01_FULL_41_67]OGN29510.1 MAG: hypothetical protein A3H54_01230 